MIVSKVYLKFLPVLILSTLAFKWVDTANKNKNEEEVVAVASSESHPESILDEDALLESETLSLYETLDRNAFTAPSLESFQKAIKGFQKMKATGLLKKDILTIVDFSLSSTVKRLWVIDMQTNTIILQSVVAHGRKSGDEFAKVFSNTNESNMSSIGFYKTGETYSGKHGFSLRLDGLEKGFNDLARQRAIVIHGADYASETFAKQQGRLGRSLGCPAIPQNIKTQLIELIKEETCLFIYYPNSDYLQRSQFLS